MAERPPLLAILDQGSTQEFVGSACCSNSTLPVIRARTASLRSRARPGPQAPAASRAGPRRPRQQPRHASRSASRNSRSWKARRSDRPAARRRSVRRRRHRTGSREEAEHDRRRGRAEATGAASSPPIRPPPRAPARPGTPPSEPKAPLDYYSRSGAGRRRPRAVAPNGVRSRGLTLATSARHVGRGPGERNNPFFGAVPSYDAVVIIDQAKAG